MKLHELTQDQCVSVIQAYVEEYNRRPELDSCVQNLIKHKKYQYTGTMYRGLIFEPSIIERAADTRLLMSRLHDYVMKEQDQKYQSWTPTIKSLETTLTNNTDGMYPNELGPWPFFVLKQHGVGLRVKNIDPDMFNTRAMHGEDEIFAPLLNNAHLSGFVLGDTGEHGAKYFAKSEFKQFVALTRERHLMWKANRW